MIVASRGAIHFGEGTGIRRRIEQGAWLTGVALLMLFGAVKLWAETERVRGLEVVRTSADRTASRARADPITSRASADPIAFRASAVSLPASVDQSSWSEARVREHAEVIRRPGDPTGALLIPSIGLEVPVYAGTTEINLNRGAAHIEGTAPLGARGNTGIAAHRDGFFRPLEALRVDAEVLIEVGGRTVSYRVVEIGIVEPTDVHVLARTETPSVTLVTCYPFYFVGNAPERYIVRAELVDSHGAFAGEARASAP